MAYLLATIGYLGFAVLLGRFMSLNKRKCHIMPAQNGRLRSEIARVKQIVASSAWHREQLDARLHELCAFFGTHPNEETLERDWCIEVICDGAPLQSLFDRVENLRREEAAQLEQE